MKSRRPLTATVCLCIDFFHKSCYDFSTNLSKGGISMPIIKAEAMIQLMCKLNTGIRSAEEEGWIASEDFRTHFANRRNENK
jgi:hypothetical protein